MSHIKINHQEKALVNGETGELLRPTCFDVLVTYDSYLRSRGALDQADELLNKVFEGEMVISNMIEQAQLNNLI